MAINKFNFYITLLALKGHFFFPFFFTLRVQLWKYHDQIFRYNENRFVYESKLYPANVGAHISGEKLCYKKGIKKGCQIINFCDGRKLHQNLKF